MIWYCGCGCGNFANFGKIYVYGHSTKGKKRPDVLKRNTENNSMKSLYSRNKISESNKKVIKTEEWKHKISISIKSLGDNHPSKRKDFREQHSKRMLGIKNPMSNIKRPGHAAYMNSFVKNPSKPQVKLFEMTKSLCYCAVLNFPVEEINKNIDIAIPLHKIAIEYDGSYWHQDEEKDAKRQEQLELLGWKFIRYKDYIPSLDELKKSIMEVHI